MKRKQPEPERRKISTAEDDEGKEKVAYFEQTDNEFQEWILQELKAENPALHEQYPNVFLKIAICILKWRKRFTGNAPLWNRIFKRDRVVKEAIESVPIIQAVEKWMITHENVTVIDLCSGKGYLSMLLSEYLEEPQRCKKCILIDKAWPLCHTKPKPHHINWEHIYGDVMEDNPKFLYYETWPIPLVTSKQDLKQAITLRQLQQRFKNQGPILILAIHLCGTLSLQAIKLFHSLPEATTLILKPCCLPGVCYQKRQDFFEIGSFQFPTKDVCSSGKWLTKKKVDGRWKGPPRWQLEGKFHKWCSYLHEGLASSTNQQEQMRTKLLKIPVQTKGGYQNTFLFAEKEPFSSGMWNEISQKTIEDDDTTGQNHEVAG